MKIINNRKVIAYNGSDLLFICNFSDCNTCKHKFRCFSEEYLFESYKGLKQVCSLFKYDYIEAIPTSKILNDILFEGKDFISTISTEFILYDNIQ